jgi:hypothetical protein
MSLVGIRSKAVKMTLSLNVQSLGVLWCGPIAYGVDPVLGHEVLDIANVSSRVGHAVQSKAVDTVRDIGEVPYITTIRGLGEATECVIGSACVLNDSIPIDVPIPDPVNLPPSLLFAIPDFLSSFAGTVKFSEVVG